MEEKLGDCLVIHASSVQKTSFDITGSANFGGTSSADGSDVDATPIWHFIGEYNELQLKKCQRLYCRKGSRHDLSLFFHNGEFHAMGAWCSHMGGPLFEGQIEDYNGSCHVMCPWHAYMFNLKTGKNELGIEQPTYKVKVEKEKVYILYHSQLSPIPYL